MLSNQRIRYQGHHFSHVSWRRIEVSKSVVKRLAGFIEDMPIVVCSHVGGHFGYFAGDGRNFLRIFLHVLRHGRRVPMRVGNGLTSSVLNS